VKVEEEFKQLRKSFYATSFESRKFLLCCRFFFLRLKQEQAFLNIGFSGTGISFTIVPSGKLSFPSQKGCQLSIKKNTIVALFYSMLQKCFWLDLGGPWRIFNWWRVFILNTFWLSLPRILKIKETRTYEMRPIRMHKIHHLAGSFVVCANLLRNSTTMIYTIFFVTHNFFF
jgi:hypothetical protein